MGVWMLVMLAFMIVYMYMLTRKDKKRQQAEELMRENLKIGDEVLTIGGILGRVITVKDDSVVIETGADRNRIRFTKSAIAKNITLDKKADEIKAAKLEAAKSKAAGRNVSAKNEAEKPANKNKNKKKKQK
ncbi:MAG: preprotein translocase subunit YajC [Ruminococcaceae bacterium]|nr:preprotein translocase subunit YajC [Oscillospiraceae bacterium]